MQIRLTDLIDPQYYKLHDEIKHEEYSEILAKGGRGSIKSSTISVEIMLGLQKDQNACAVVYRKFLNTVELTVYEQMQWAVQMLNLRDWNFVKSSYKAVNRRTGQVIIFKGLDKAEKTKSLKPPSGKYWKYLWFEEADQFANDAELRMVKQSVFRGYNGQTLTFYSWNPPRLLSHWIYDFEKKKTNARHHFSCYLNVARKEEWLGRSFLEEAEELKRTNPTAYAHEYLGKGSSTDGLVFGMFRRKTHIIKSLNQGEKILRTIFAIDPATENDATAGVPVHITSLGRAVVGKVFYYDPTAPGCSPLAPSAQVELINKWLRKLKGTKWAWDMSKTYIIFDPAGAPLRREMTYQTGLKAYVISKTTIIQSVWALQDLLENGTLYFLEDNEWECPLTGRKYHFNPLIKELESLSWGDGSTPRKKSGVIPEGQKQDCIDALRYGTHYFTNPQLTHQFEYAKKLIVNA